MTMNGLSALAPNQLGALVTFLEHPLAGIAETPALPTILPEGYRLEAIRPEELVRYRELFRAVGEPWLWFSRLRMPETDLAALLAEPDVEALALVGDAGDLGLVELDFRAPAAAELAFFGLVPGLTGRGLGQSLMGVALHRASQKGVGRLHVHTCSLDHPGALEFYVKAGFVATRRAIEVFEDPRLDGTLPREAAPHLPLIES
jgi:GNAT superfamily N-acetyltransferase